MQNEKSISEITSFEEILALKHKAIAQFVDKKEVRYYKSAIVRLAEKLDSLGLLGFILYAIKWPIKRFLAKSSNTNIDFPGVDASTFKENEIYIAVILHGGIGDFVNSSAFLTALYEKYNLPKADLFNDAVSPMMCIFENAPFKRNLWPFKYFESLKHKYAIIIGLSDWCSFEFNYSDQLLAEHNDLIEAYRKNEKVNTTLKHYVDHHPLLDGHFSDEMITKGINRVKAPGVFIGLDVDEDRHYKIYTKLPDEYFFEGIGLNISPYITVHDGFGGESNLKVEFSTKQWSIEYWEKLISLLKSVYPNIKIVQLGGKKSRIIKNVDICFLNTLSLKESILVLSKSILHIDNESGLVRIAKAYGVKSVVLFGATNPKYYGFKTNINIFPNFCGNCFWSTTDWMAKCPRGFETPLCMDSILPQQVFERIKQESTLQK
jgi:ADP-heptose:LPS heptosyltransferase